MKHGITFAWTLNGAGGGERIEPDRVAEEIRNIGTAWVHINDTNRSARRWIEREFAYLDPLIVDALLADITHPRYLEHNGGILLILRGVNLNPAQKPEDMVSIRVWADEHRIITIERRKVKTIQLMDMSFSKGDGPRDSGDFLTTLIWHVLEHLEDLSGELHQQLDAIELLIEEGNQQETRPDIMGLRRAAVTFLRYVMPQRDVLSHLRQIDLPWITAQHRRDFAEEWDRLNRITRDLELLRSRSQIAFDELNSLSSQKVNRNLYILSTIAGIFMPMTFVTGLLGMNVGIPGADNGSAFWMICGGLASFGILLAALLKWLKWL